MLQRLITCYIFKKEIEEFKSLAYWNFQTIQNLIQFITHELYPSNVSVIVDVDDNPQMDCGGDTYSGNCHPLYIECTCVIIVYCKRSFCSLHIWSQGRDMSNPQSSRSSHSPRTSQASVSPCL